MNFFKWGEVDELKDNNEKLTQTVASLSDIVKSQAKDRDILTQTMREMNTILEPLKGENEQLKTKLRMDRLNLEASIKTLTKTLSDTKSQLASIKAENKRLTELLNAAGEAIEASKSRISACETTHKPLIQNLQTHNEHLNKLLVETQTKLDTYMKEQQAIREQSKTAAALLQEEKEVLIRSLKDSKDETHTYHIKIEYLVADVEKLHKTNESISSSLAEKQDLIRSLESEKSNLALRLSDEQAKVRSVQEENYNLDKLLRDADNEAVTQKAILEKFRLEKDHLSEMLNEALQMLDAQASDALAATPQQQDRIDQLENEMEAMRNQCVEHQRKIHVLEQELKDTKTQHNMSQLTNKQKMLQQRDEFQEKYKQLAAQQNDQSQEFQETKEKAELINEWMEQLKKREKELEQQSQEFQEKCDAWQKTIVSRANSTASQAETSTELLESVQQANFLVEKYKVDIVEKHLALKQSQLELEDVKMKLAESENQLKQKQACFESYLAVVEQQGLLPEARYFHELLKSTKHMANVQKENVKCFISYAWYTDPIENAKLQGRLTKLKGDLTKAGITVMLDIHNMEGDIDKYMAGGISACDKVLLIYTPRFKVRADDPTSNNLQKELRAALDRQKLDAKFVVPLLFDGDFSTSVSASMPNILYLDFTDPLQYIERMISLNPKGLIPMLYGLDSLTRRESNKLYGSLVQNYRNCLELITSKGVPKI